MDRASCRSTAEHFLCRWGLELPEAFDGLINQHPDWGSALLRAGVVGEAMPSKILPAVPLSKAAALACQECGTSSPLGHF